MTANASRLAAAGHLPAGLTLQQASDVLWTYSSPELYDLLVLRSGWDLPRFATFVTNGLTAQLLTAAPQAGPRLSGDPRDG
jgi:hypothetical protein